MDDNSLREQLRTQLREQIAPAFCPEVPLARQREVLDQMGAGAQLPGDVTLEVNALAQVHAERLAPAGARDDQAILYLHGGGYVMGSCASHRALAANIARSTGITTHLPEYRLAPEHPYPAGLDDALAAYRALLDRGLAARRLAIVGDSAGGGLSLATLVRIRDEGLPMPGAAVLLSPLTDLTVSGESIHTRAAADPWIKSSTLTPFAELYRATVDAGDPRVSPLFADLHGLPPLLIHVGDDEILLDDSTRLASRARAAGVEVELEVWPRLWHVFHFFAPLLPEANAALAKVSAFLRAHLDRDAG
ncbi:MAG: alpha/beta hydrolase [Myxococcales bacterium]|nr:alpha/beta hydrolase [Myxococcales bacterium]